MIVSSTRLSANVQKDGRKAVRERHQADSGESQVREYLAEAGADLDALLAQNGRLFLKMLATRSPGGG